MATFGERMDDQLRVSCRPSPSLDMIRTTRIEILLITLVLWCAFPTYCAPAEDRVHNQPTNFASRTLRLNIDSPQDEAATIKRNSSSVEVEPEMKTVTCWSNVKSDYAVVVDCGSSKSQAHVYVRQGGRVAYVPMTDAKLGKVTKRINPGLSVVQDNPQAASDYMKPIMDFLQKFIPSDRQEQTPIYFMATAGLRFLSMETQKKILADIAHDLRLEYDFKQLHAEVIDGSDEGAYQWLSVNAAANRLSSRFNQIDGWFFCCQAPRTRRYGMLEMGGASNQVAFELSGHLHNAIQSRLQSYPEALRVYRNQVRQIWLPDLSTTSSGLTTYLFSTTFMGLGSDAARDLLIDLLVRDFIKSPTIQAGLAPQQSPIAFIPGATLVLQDPCLTYGAEETVSKPASLFYDQTKTIGFVTKPGDNSMKVKLVGRGNYYQCSTLLTRLLSLAKQERLYCEPGDYNNCAPLMIGSPFVPFAQLQFLGLSDYYYTTEEMIQASGKLDMQKIKSRAIAICSTPHKILMDIFGAQSNRVDPLRVLHECFKVTWLLSWLQVGLQLPDGSLTRADIETINSLNGSQLDWTYGALLSKMFQPTWKQQVG